MQGKLRKHAAVALSVLGLWTVGATLGYAADWQDGDVFVGVGNGSYQVYDSAGNLKETISDGLGGITTGCSFNNTGDKLYTTNFENTKVVVYDNAHPHAIVQVIDTAVTSPAGHSESIVFDAAGNFYVGHPDSNNLIHKYDSAGTLLATFAAAIELRGTDWIDLASDQCTLFYTSEGRAIKRYDACSDAQLPDFAVLPGGGNAYALRLLPPGDGSGGLVVADTFDIKRLDGAGNVVQTYDAPGEDLWFALSRDPGGTSLWSGSAAVPEFYRFGIVSGGVELGPVNAGIGVVGGLCVKGELTPKEICDDTIDNDGDTFVDCADPDCLGYPGCGTETDCSDFVDNDDDALIDCDDPDCVFNVVCQPPPETCDDGIDNDADGLVDCADPECRVGPPEVCDGVDNDCDGEVDEGTGGNPCDTGLGGTCEPGTDVCSAGELLCVPNDVSPEICDGADNDCDGEIDEDLGQTTCGLGICERTVDNCVGGVPQACVPGDPEVEICDGLDNDCDGDVDGGTGGAACDTGLPDHCAPGTEVCSAGELGCIPVDVSPETCDGIDNDCNGEIDDGLGQTTCGVGICERTIDNCVGGEPQVCVPGDPEPEVCDGFDNDCDASLDEGCDDDGDRWCDALETVIGTPPVCPNGGGDCNDEDGSVNPGAEEVCDGIDNDCDENVDGEDVDDDGVPNYCDLDDAPALSARKVVVSEGRKENAGKWRASGELHNSSPSSLIDDVLAGGVTAIVYKQAPGGGLAEVNSFRFDASQCEQKPIAIVCRDAETKSGVRLTKRSAPGFFRFKIVVRDQSLAAPEETEAPLAVAIHTPVNGIDRLDPIDACVHQKFLRRTRCIDRP